MKLPQGFISQMKELLGDESGDFLSAMEMPPSVSVRLNSRKPGAIFEDADPVKWCPAGFYLRQRPVFTLDPLLHAGAYYVQDASSMILWETVRRLANGPVSVLDMCAAPGGKTTAIIDALPDGSRIVANEFVRKRAAVLEENLTKWGYAGATVTNRDSAYFRERGDRFDIVAVDAPCSGEGMMRKEPAAVTQWNPQLIADCALLQKEIVANAAEVVKPGGWLIYSTCTFNTTENEDIARYIAETLGFIPMDMGFPDDWGIPRGIGTDLPVYRFMPHKTRGEGLFLAVFRRPPDATEAEEVPYVPNRKAVSRLSEGKIFHKMASEKPGAGIPSMKEILAVRPGMDWPWPTAEIDLPSALSYLRRETIVLPEETPRGLVVLTYKGLPLGPAKNIGSRANNLYPKEWRILMR